MRMILVYCLLLISGRIFSQESYRPAPPPEGKIVKMEYFIDADPGIGMGVNIPITADQNIINKEVEVPLNGLYNGIHILYVRSMDEEGIWSHVSSFLFDNFLLPSYSNAPSRPLITDAEYFIDNDPGFGNGTPISIPDDTSLHTNVLVNLNGIVPGVHQLYIRTKDESGKWSLTNISIFDNNTIDPYRPAPLGPEVLTDLEYYIDTDPGFGLGRKITIPAAANLAAFSVDIDISGLSEGEHVLYFRSREIPWSLSAYVPVLVGSVLPVSWLYVKATASQENALIEWATTQEVNSEKYIVEYSLDGRKFSEAGEIVSKNQPGGSSYSFRHKTENTGLYYYRIRQVDRDGKFNYSRVVQLFIGTGNNTVKVYPNPVKDMLYVQLQDGQNVNQVILLDQQGRMLKILKGAVLKDRPLIIPMIDLPPGFYTIKLFFKDAVITYPLMKN